LAASVVVVLAVDSPARVLAASTAAKRFN
jgi:hypothetical protein